MFVETFKNIIYYLENNLSTFEEQSFNEVDALIFTWLSYYHISDSIYKKESFDELAIKDFYNAKYFDSMTFDVFDIPNSKKLLSRVAASPRFRDLTVFYYSENTDKKIEKQFSAMTFKMGNNEYFVAYRGTDHSFVGWKEDFNMSFLKHIPAQIDAKDYLTKVMSEKKGEYTLGGHSKGGNLAMYAASFVDSEYKKRIKCIYNFDGPSLNSKLISDDGYGEIKNLIKKYVPQSSMVGMCFENTSDYKIINSNSVGVLQHNPFTWEVSGNNLKILNDSSFDSKAFKSGINALVSTLSESEIKQFIDSIYNVLETTKADTAEEFIKDLPKNLAIVLGSIGSLNDEQKNLLFKVAKIYISESFNGLIKM